MGFFKKTHWSITTISKYPEMLMQGIGKAFLYLFLFTLIFGTINSLIIGFQINQSVGSFIDDIKGELPEFSFDNGELTINEPMPIVFQDGTDILIIDTTGQTSPSVLDKYDTGALVLKDRMINKESPVKTSIINYEQFQGVSFTDEDINNLLPYLQWISVIVGVVIWIGFFLGKMFSALLVSVILLIISSIRKANISFGKLYSLGIYTLTLPILIDIALQIFHIDLHNLFYYLIALVYGWFAISQFKKQSTYHVVDNNLEDE